jgi:aminoglycoside 6'-N-acetyltransferase I
MISRVEIRRAKPEDLRFVAQLALALWPDNDAAELTTEMRALLEDEEVAIFLAYTQDECLGFAQCQLHRDYVEDTATSPVGYLEGIFVQEEWRSRGVGGRLLAACEEWAREHNCQEFASDCELENQGSLIFHERTGFKEVNRLICFVKKL